MRRTLLVAVALCMSVPLLASAAPSVARLNLHLADLPAGWSQVLNRTLSRAQIPADGLDAAERRVRSLLIVENAEAFQGAKSNTNGVAPTVISGVQLYRSAGGAHIAFLALARPASISNFDPKSVHALSVPETIGDEQAMFSAPDLHGRSTILIWRLGSYVATIAVGPVTALPAATAVRLGRIVATRIRHAH